MREFDSFLVNLLALLDTFTVEERALIRENDELLGFIYTRSLLPLPTTTTTMSSPNTNPNISKLLGNGVTIRANHRTASEIATQAKLYPKGNRATLKTADAKSYAMMVKLCTTGMETKFALLEPIDIDSGSDRLKKSYNIMVRMNELKEKIVRADMEDVFSICQKFDSSGLPTVDATFVDLLDTSHGITFDDVLKTSKIFAVMSSGDYHPQNLDWSGQMILASCEDDLKEKIQEAANKVNNELRGGPVYLFLMRQLILSTSEKAMRGLTDKITALRIKHINGENVLQAGSYLKGALTLLRTHDRVPNDMRLLIFQIFAESSTQEFNDHVKNIQGGIATAELFKTGVTLTVDTIIEELEKKYSDLLGRDQWEAKSTTTDQNSAFMTDLAMVICFNCGACGHTVPNCPHPRNENMINMRKEIILGQRKKSAEHGSKGSDSSNKKSDKPRKKKSGKGGKGGGGKGNPLRVPPVAGDSHEKVVDGKTLHWCGHCASWVNHKTGDASCPNKKGGGDKSQNQNKSGSSGGSNAESGAAEGSVAGFNLSSLSGAMASNFA